MVRLLFTQIEKAKKGLLFTLLCLLTASQGLFAQIDAQFTLFPWASLYYNPGTGGGVNNTLSFTGIFKSQYTGFTDKWLDDNKNPQENYVGALDGLFSMDFYSRKIRGSLNLCVVSENLGATNYITAQLGYTYRMNIGPGRLGLGLQARFFNSIIDPTQLHAIQASDPVLNAMSESNMFFDLNFGAYYKTETWSAGISGVQLLGKEASPTLSGEKLKPYRHIYIHGGYVWNLPWFPNWNIEPNLLLKTDLTKKMPQIDLMVLGRYNETLWMGLSYRIVDAVSVLFGARPFANSSNNYLKGLDVGMSYSFTTSKLGLYKSGKSSGDVEVMLRYSFDIFRQEVFSGYGSSRNIYKNQY